MADGVSDFADIDPEETAEWLEAVDAVIAAEGPARAQDLLQRVITGAARRGVPMTPALSMPYLNSLPPAADQAADDAADEEIERRIRAYVRWNAMAMVLRANAESSELGGHIASYQ